MTTGFRTPVTQLGVTTTFAPDAWNNIASSTDARGTVTSFTYDNAQGERRKANTDAPSRPFLPGVG